MAGGKDIAKGLEEAVNLIIGGGKAAKKVAGKAAKARPKLPPRSKAPISDAEIENILAEGGLAREDLRRRYPDIGEPVPSIDKMSGKAYLAKGQSREGSAVAAVRDRVVKDMKKYGYESRFDKNKRYDANKGAYNRPDVTAGLVPSRADTVKKYNDLYAGPETQARLDAAIAKGIKNPDAHGFYMLGQLEDEFIRELGPIEGPKMFQERVADSLAATTGGADPTSNLLMAAYGNYLKEAIQNPEIGRNLPPISYPKAAYEMPYPIGGRFATGNMEMYDKMMGVTQPGTGVTGANPKRYDFSSSFLGYTDRPVVDEQMMKAIDPTSKGAPARNAYGVAREAIGDAGGRAGLSPIGGQEVGWAGIKDSSGKPMIENINEMLYRTSRITGETLDEVLKRFIRAKGPMFGIAGGGAMGGLLSGGGEEGDM